LFTTAKLENMSVYQCHLSSSLLSFSFTLSVSGTVCSVRWFWCRCWNWSDRIMLGISRD